MLKATDTRILPAQHRAGEVAAAVQQQQRAKDQQQHEDACRAAVEQRRKKLLIGRLLILGYLVLPSLMFGECPRSPWAPGMGRLYEFPNNFTTQIGDALAPTGLSALSVISLIVLLGIVLNQGTARKSIQPRRNESQTRQMHRP